MCLSEPSGKVGHAEIKIGDSRIMLADEYPEMGSRGPQSFGGSPVSILLYMDDCDAISTEPSLEGAKVVKPIERSVLWRSGRNSRGSIRTHLGQLLPTRKTSPRKKYCNVLLPDPAKASCNQVQSA